MDVRGILFDLDDTLYEYAPCNARGLEAAGEMLRRRVGVAFADFMELHDEVRGQLARELRGQAASHNRALFFKRMVERLIERPEPGLVRELYECYWQAFYNHVKPHPEMHRVLEKLNARYRMALVSNHTTLPQLGKIEVLDIGLYFPVVVTSEEAGVEKPDPGIFRLALAQLELEAAEAVFVGDSLRGDIEGAAQLGMGTIHTVEFIGETSEESIADHTILNLVDLLDLL